MRISTCYSIYFCHSWSWASTYNLMLPIPPRHFVNKCQEEDGKLSQSPKLPFLAAYVYKYPFDVEGGNIFSVERRAELDKVRNPQVKEQKFYAWKLLEYALSNSAGLDVKSIQFAKANGKWTCNDCYFSISHCNNVVAVAVSNDAVGIDVELISPTRFNDDLARRILTERELDELQRLSGDERAVKLNSLWTVKEAAFKCGDETVFAPSRIETVDASSVTKQLVCGDQTYFLTVASRNAHNAVFYLRDIHIL